MNEEEYINKLATYERNIKLLKRKQAEIANNINILQAEKDDLQHQYKLSKIQDRESANVWAQKKFEWSDKMHKILKDIFHFENFRMKQLAAINATLSKKDVLLLMPTGGGKSLVYQLPVLLNKHLTLVVSPLISLIEDQLMALQKLSIGANTLNANSTREEKKHIHNEMLEGNSKLKLLYVTPEWVMKNKTFMSYLQKCFEKGYLDRIVIDEVHCCSHWGHDFRPEYLQLGLFKNLFPGVPILGLTATATMNILVDIQNILNLEDALILTAPFNRPNLYYKVINKPSETKECYDTIAKLLQTTYKDQTGIIYTNTIKETEDISNGLRERGLKVKFYHGRLEPNDKKVIQQRWMQGKYQAVVATIAFGMGIDKPDVRFVIHYTIPKSMEGFYQESGRAGRDGQKADCILMFGLADFLSNVGMASSTIQDKNAKSMLAYCLEQKRCRRSMISEYFGDQWRETDCAKMCDHCKHPQEVTNFNVASALEDVLKLIDAASMTGKKLTLLKLITTWFQSRSKDLQLSGLTKPKCSKKQAEYIIGYFIFNEYLSIEKSFTAYTVIAYIKKGPKAETKGTIIVPNTTNLNYPKAKEEVIDLEEEDEIKENHEEFKNKRMKFNHD